MIYTITDEQIKQFTTDRFEDVCSNCAFYHTPECKDGSDCAEGYLRHNITPLKKEHFSKMSTETLCSLMDVLQSEIKNRENDERIQRLRQRYKELSQEAKELGVELC